MASYLDATADTEALAAERESALLALTENVDLAVPRLRAATDAVAQTERTLAQLTAEHDLLTSIRLPDGINELDTAITAQQQALQRAKDAELSAQAADAAARDALAAAPDRGPLEQARREHAEQRRILTEVPSARTDVEAAATRLEQAGQQSTAAGQAVDTSRDARDAAASDAAAASSLVARLTIEAESLSAVTLPGGLTELDDRIHTAAGTLTDSAERLAAAERADAAARAALRDAPPRGPLELTLRQVAELAVATAAVEPIRQRAQQASQDQLRTQSDLAAATAARDKARAARDKAVVASGAAALRPHLVAGDACPVCEQVVTTLPPSAHAPKLAAADKAAAAADAKVQKARTEDLKAAQLVAAVDAQLTTATERVAALQSALDGQPTDEAVIREALSGLDRLDSQARAADESVRQARSQNTAAQATVRQVETDASVLRRSLQQTRDPLVALGAPQVDGSHLLASWTQLTEWAAAQSDSRRQALLAARPADEAAQAALRLAEKGLADARTREAQARKAETEATASHRAGQGRAEGTADPAGRTHRVPVRCAERLRRAGPTGADR